mgnify:CR=1 FL=1
MRNRRALLFFLSKLEGLEQMLAVAAADAAEFAGMIKLVGKTRIENPAAVKAVADAEAAVKAAMAK